MDHSGKRSEKRWYRKAQVGARYGGVLGRWIARSRMVGCRRPSIPLRIKFLTGTATIWMHTIAI